MLVEWNSRNLVRRIHGPFELGFMLISARNCRFEILWNQVFENIASDPMMIEDRELLGENQREKQKQNRNKHTLFKCFQCPKCFHLKASTAKVNAMKVRIFLIAILIVFSLGKQYVLISQNRTFY